MHINVALTGIFPIRVTWPFPVAQLEDFIDKILA